MTKNATETSQSSATKAGAASPRTKSSGPHAAVLSLDASGLVPPTDAIESADGPVETELLRGVRAHAVGDLALAAEHYLRAHRGDRESQAIRNNLGLLYFQQGRLDMADEWLAPLEHWDHPSAMSLMNLGNLRLAQGSVAVGLALLERSVVVGPDEATWISLGRARMLTGNMTGAEEAFTEAAVRLEPRADVLEHLGACYLQRGAVDEAIAIVESAVELDPDSASAWRQLSAALLARRDLGSAVSAARRSVDLRPDDALSIQQLVTTLVAMGRAEDARDVLDSALSLLDSTELVVDRAVLALAEGDAAHGVALLSSLDTRTERADLYLGFALLMTDKRRDARRALRAAAAGNGEHAERARTVLAELPARETGTKGRPQKATAS